MERFEDPWNMWLSEGFNNNVLNIIPISLVSMLVSWWRWHFSQMSFEVVDGSKDERLSNQQPSARNGWDIWDIPLRGCVTSGEVWLCGWGQHVQAFNPPNFSGSLWSGSLACFSILSAVWRLSVVTLAQWDADFLSSRMKSGPRLRGYETATGSRISVECYSTEVTFNSWGACLKSYGDIAPNHDTVTATLLFHQFKPAFKAYS